jgi:hypothetical protein
MEGSKVNMERVAAAGYLYKTSALIFTSEPQRHAQKSTVSYQPCLRGELSLQFWQGTRQSMYNGREMEPRRFLAAFLFQQPKQE